MESVVDGRTVGVCLSKQKEEESPVRIETLTWLLVVRRKVHLRRQIPRHLLVGPEIEAGQDAVKYT